MSYNGRYITRIYSYITQYSFCLLFLLFKVHRRIKCLSPPHFCFFFCFFECQIKNENIKIRTLYIFVLLSFKNKTRKYHNELRLFGYCMICQRYFYTKPSVSNIFISYSTNCLIYTRETY